MLHPLVGMIQPGHPQPSSNLKSGIWNIDIPPRLLQSRIRIWTGSY